MPLALLLTAGGVSFLAASAGAQDLSGAQDLFARGKYAEVIAMAEKQVKEGGYRTDWRVLLVKSLLEVGRYDEAYTNAQEGLDGFSANIPLRLLARQTALFHNKPAEANRRLVEIQSLLEQRQPSYRDGEELVALGQVLLLSGVEPRLVLENCFQRAEKLTPPTREAFRAAGQLALDKHDYKLAADAFRAGLKTFPEDPGLETGLAQAYAPDDAEEMGHAIEAALKTNPRHVPALLLLADHLIDAEQYDEAEKQLALALTVNPWQPEALAYRAVLAYLRNNAAAA